MNKLKNDTYYFVAWKNSYVILMTKEYDKHTNIHYIEIIEENYENDDQSREGWTQIDYNVPYIYRGCWFISMKNINDKPKNYNILYSEKK